MKATQAILWFVVVVFYPIVALAKGEAEQSWWHVLVLEFIKVSLAIAVPVLSTLAAVLLQRWRIKIEAEQVEKLARGAAGFAEEKAAQAFKEGKPRSSGAEKMATAIQWSHQMAGQYGAKRWTIERLTNLIEAELGQKKVKAEPPKKPEA